MEITYTGANGLFTQLGKLIKHYNLLKEDGTNLTADCDEILDGFQQGDKDVAINGLVAAFERWKSEYVGRRSEFVEYVFSRLQEQDVLKALGVSATDVNETLAALVTQMEADSRRVEASSTSVTVATAATTNKGGGVLFTTPKLDGATSPGTFNGVQMRPHLSNRGKETQFVGAEDFKFRVVADSFQDGLPNGDAEITWNGCPSDEPNGLSGGSGFVGTIRPLNAVTGQYINNSTFDSFTSSVPDEWKIEEGAAGSDIKQASVAPGNSGLHLSGTGKISQVVGRDRIIANKMYGLSVMVRNGSTPVKETEVITNPSVGIKSTPAVKIRFEGTGYAADASEQIEVLVSDLSNQFQLEHCFILMPSIIPDDFRIVVSTTGGAALIDDLSFGPVSYGGGFGVIAIRDSGPFVRGDQFEVTTTNDTSGVFQEFFTKVLGTQLPTTGNSPIADSLAT